VISALSILTFYVAYKIARKYVDKGIYEPLRLPHYIFIGVFQLSFWTMFMLVSFAFRNRFWKASNTLIVNYAKRYGIS